MKARLEYLMQYPVDNARKKDGDLVIHFADSDGKIKVRNWQGKAPEIEGLSLLNVVRAQGAATITFGRATEDGVEDAVNVVIDKDMKFKIDLPGYDDEDRDLSIPAHPDERVAAGPTEPPTQTESPRRPKAKK